MLYNKHNFHRNTFCEFQEVAISAVDGLKMQYKSKSGSSYYFTEKGVFRLSNHWGRAANCRWRLLPISKSKTNNTIAKMGYANWTDFYPNNDNENLFYIEVNWATNEVLFHHKNNPKYNDERLRNAAETTKVIQKIKKILLNDNWAKYYEFSNLETFKRDFVKELLKK